MASRTLYPRLGLSLVSGLQRKLKTSNNFIEKGFTLVELMVVLVIIGILILIITPNFLAARDAANKRAGQGLVTNDSKQCSTILISTGAGTGFEASTAPNSSIVYTPPAACAEDTTFTAVVTDKDGGTTTYSVTLTGEIPGGLDVSTAAAGG